MIIFAGISIVVGMIVTILLMTLPGMLLRGWVFSVLWNWFVPLAFPGAPQMHVGAAMGLSIILGMCFVHMDIKKDDEEKGPDPKKVVALLFFPLISLVVGAFIHIWVH